MKYSDLQMFWIFSGPAPAPAISNCSSKVKGDLYQGGQGQAAVSGPWERSPLEVLSPSLAVTLGWTLLQALKVQKKVSRVSKKWRRRMNYCWCSTRLRLMTLLNDGKISNWRTGNKMRHFWIILSSKWICSYIINFLMQYFQISKVTPILYPDPCFQETSGPPQ